MQPTSGDTVARPVTNGSRQVFKPGSPRGTVATVITLRAGRIPWRPTFARQNMQDVPYLERVVGGGTATLIETGFEFRTENANIC